MTRQFRDSESGFYVTSNDDSWQVGYQPPAPAPEPAAEKPWGNGVGQGANRDRTHPINNDELKDFNFWLNNKDLVNERLAYLNELLGD
jgi:hypothetical protein